jgi:hypothetical protein
MNKSEPIVSDKIIKDAIEGTYVDIQFNNKLIFHWVYMEY